MPDALADAAAPEAEAGPQTCVWTAPPGATYGCWAYEPGLYGENGFQCFGADAAPSFASFCSSTGIACGGNPDAGSCRQVWCMQSDGDCTLYTPGVVACGGTVPTQFAQFVDASGITCSGNAWVQTLVQTPAGPFFGMCCSSQGCC